MQVCQLAAAVGRRDLLHPMLEELRAVFGRLRPAAVAELLAWLPANFAAPLLRADVRGFPASPAGICYRSVPYAH